MHPRTIATLEDLERTTWFDRVGERDTESASVLTSWLEAVQYCGSPEWENLCLEAANGLAERLAERSPEKFARWNEIVEEVKSATVPFVRRKIEAVVKQYHLPKVFEDVVQWDILHVCLEAEYADVVSPGFYASQAYWYVQGHFPCGWQDSFPEGKLVIY